MSVKHMSHYANRFASGVSIGGLPVINTHPNNVFWANSNTGKGSDSLATRGATPQKPFASLDYAVGRCTANVGDVIYLMPGYSETISAAAQIALDVAGITIIGLGRGTDRPQLTFTETDATIPVTAANISMQNVHLINDKDALVVGIPVTAAHFTITDCLFDDATAAKNTLHWMSGSAAADYLTVANCDNHGTDTAGNTGFITMGAADHFRFVGNTSHGDFSAANVIMTAACTDAHIEGNRLQNANGVDVCIEGFAAATGWVAHNFMFIATDTQLTSINTPGAMALFENYHVNVGGETGILVGTPSA